MTSAYEHMSHDLSRFTDISNETHTTFGPLQGYEAMPLVSFEKATSCLIAHVPDIERMVKAVRRNLIEPKDGLTLDESASIMLYSMRWIPKESSFYYVLNQTLRSINRKKLLSPWLLYLRLFITALGKLHSNCGEQIYCGAKMDLREYYRVGTCIVWPGFTSCTPNIHLLESAQSFGLTDTRTLFSIHCETGKNIRQHSFSHTEDEIVFLSGVEFEVMSSLDMGNGLHTIHLKEIQNRFPNAPTILPSHQSSTTIKNHFSDKNVKSLARDSETQKLDIREREHSSKLHKKSQKLTDADVQRFIEESLRQKDCNELDLSWNKITHEGVTIIAQALKTNQTLLSLDLRGNDIDEKGAEHLADVLRTNKILIKCSLGGDLFYGYNSIGDTGVKYLADALRQNQALKTLDLSSNQITETGACHLAYMLKENTTLVSLNISGNQIDEIGAEYLAQALKQNSTLTTLNLAINKIGDLGAEHFGSVLQQNKMLTILNLEHNQIRDIGMKYLANGLRQNATLTTLDLRQNQLGDDGAEHLAIALLQNSSLTTLYLQSNKIREKGAQYLADSLQHNAVLKILSLGGRLYLKGNSMGDAGAQYFAEVIKHNKILTTLDIGYNDISDLGGHLIANVLPHNRNNTISDEGAQHLTDSLRRNKTLQELHLSNNQISPSVQEQLKEQDNRIKFLTEKKINS